MIQTRLTQLGGFAAILLVAFLLDEAVTRALPDMPDILVSAAHLVTGLGNSAWLGVTLPVIALVAALTVIRTNSPNARYCARVTLCLCIALFLSVLFSGIFVQLLKHGFGRARPELFTELGAYSFHPFIFDYSFNSFPSGHATTAGAVAWFLCWLLPRHRSLILTLTVIVAMTRVLTGHHYPSDVVAGFALGMGTSWLMIRALLMSGKLPARHDPVFAMVRNRMATRIKRFGTSLSWSPPMRDPLYMTLLITILIGLNAAMVLFFAAPQIDVAVSSMFFDAQKGFALADDPVLGAIRMSFLRIIQLAAILSLIAYLLWWRLYRRLRIPRALPAFAMSSFAVGPALLVNGVFKSNWGRARPAEIETFSGERLFTLPFERADQCLSNCSFPSGEGAGIAMFVIVGGVLLWPWLNRRRWVVAPVLIIALFGIGLRVAMGRHFLSDSVFSVLMMAAVALILWRWCASHVDRSAMTRDALAADLGVIGQYLLAPLSAKTSLRGDVWSLMLAILCVLQTTARLLAAMSLGMIRQVADAASLLLRSPQPEADG